MKNIFFGVLTLLVVGSAFSQSKPLKISGTLTAKDTNKPLESATVYLERVQDSTVVAYTISDKSGKFVIEDRTAEKSLNLYVSFIGYKTYKKHILLNKRNIELNTITLETAADVLDEVVIKSRAPITIKKDTLEFNVKSFNTKKDANVEDLLKQLPGVKVNRKGEIKINGKKVDNILVNGKPFFGNDPTVATRNLSKDIIEKVQVVDTKTKDQAFTGEEANTNSKTINLTIKEENNKGIFARVAAGIGTNKRYELAGMFSRFNNDRRISVLAGANNINSPGFSFGEISRMFDGGDGDSYDERRSFGGGRGITTSKTAGVNYADKFGENLDVAGDYLYTRSDSNDKTTTNREHILTDSRYFTASNSSSVSSNDSHRVSSELEYKLDSTLLISVRPSLNISKNKTISRESQASRNANKALVNSSNAASTVNNKGQKFDNAFSITKKYGTKGGFFRVHLNNNINKRTSKDFLNSTTKIFENNPINPNSPNVIEQIDRDQFRDGKFSSNGISTGITYRLPLSSKTLFLDFKYSYENSNRKNKLISYNKDTAGNYSIRDNSLSTNFKYQDQRHIPELRFSYKKGKLSTGIETSYVFRKLKNEDLLRPTLSVKRNFKNIQLSTYLRYRFKAESLLDFRYSVSNNPPELNQLQQFENITDPLNKVIGNPFLKPSNRHNISIDLQRFNFQKKSGLFASISANFNNNMVISKSIIDNNLVRTTTFENVNGNYNINFEGEYEKQFKLNSKKSINAFVGLESSFNNIINFNNDVKYTSKVKSFSPNLGVEFYWRDIMEVETNYNLSLTNNTYNIEAFKNEQFVSHAVSLNTATMFPEKLEWQNSITYNYNPNIAAGFQKSAWFWNATLSYSIIKNRGSISLKAYDILNQNTNARRIATANYIQDSQSTVLQRYFMLGFSWKFNSMKKKGEDDHYGEDDYYGEDDGY